MRLPVGLFGKAVASNPAISVVGNTAWAASNASQLTVATSWANVGNLALLPFATGGASNNYPTAVSATKTGSWTCVASYFDTTTNTYVGIWMATVTAKGSDTVAVADANIGTNFGSLWCREFTATSPNWTAIAASNVAGSSGPGHGSGTTVDCPSLAASGDNNLYVGVVRSVYGDMPSGSTSGFIYEGDSSAADQILYDTAVAGSVAPTSTQTNTGTYDAIGVMLRA
jgi:hypothetical protein